MKIVISLGGSVIIPDKVDLDYLNKFKKTILKLKKKHKIIIVTGGGSIARTYIDALKKDKKYENISGLGYKLNGVPVINNISKPFDFSQIGKYHFELMDISKWTEIKFGNHYMLYPAFHYYASKGCPMRCSFCVNSIDAFYNKRRVKKIKDIIDDIKYLLSNANIRCLSFSDEYFFGTPTWFSEFLDSLEKSGLNLKWGSTFHIKVILSHPELILRAKSLGLEFVQISPESGSDRMLNLLNKKITVDDTIKCFEFLVKNKIPAIGNFMTHLPTETEEERMATFELQQKLQKMYDDDNLSSYFMGPTPYRPYPGTQLYQQYILNKCKEPASLDEWEKFISPVGAYLIEEDYFWTKK